MMDSYDTSLDLNRETRACENITFGPVQACLIMCILAVLAPASLGREERIIQVSCCGERAQVLPKASKIRASGYQRFKPRYAVP